MSPGKTVTAVLGGLVALLAAGLIAGGGGLLWAYGTQRTADGYFTSPTFNLTTDAYALTSAQLDLGSQPGDWLPSGRLATVRLDVESMSTIDGDDRDPAPVPVFVGIGRQAHIKRRLEPLQTRGDGLRDDAFLEKVQPPGFAIGWARCARSPPSRSGEPASSRSW